MAVLKYNHTIAFFLAFLLLFLADSVVNYYVDLPLFVAGGLILLPLMIVFSKLEVKNFLTMLFIIIVFIITAVTNSILYVYNEKNISDALFICLFVTSYYFYLGRYEEIRSLPVIIFAIASLLLFIPTFFGINAGGSTLDTGSHDIEFQREYNQGFYRIAHIASYFFGFFTIFFLFKYSISKKLSQIIFALIFFAACLYTGARTFLLAGLLAVAFYYMKNLKLRYIIAIAVFIIIIFVIRPYILEITRKTVLYQYFTIFETTVENPKRLSRFMIWRSWWGEMKYFSLRDFITGRAYYNAHLTNWRKLNYDVWFHNDYFNIVYSYGLICLALYLYFIVQIFLQFKEKIMNNLFIWTFFFSMVIAAFLNGLYYYFPVFLIYIFFYMMKYQTKTQIKI